MDVSPKQTMSVETSLIPFLEHDDATRAEMGSNMMRQWVPLLKTDSPVVGTGMERIVWEGSGYVVVAKDDGEVLGVDAKHIMPWKGFNFEDAIIISDRLVHDDVYTSVHIKEYSMDVRETKLGPEQTTDDIPNVSFAKLKDLDAEGIIRVGAYVEGWDLLVGKITPKGEQELSPEERLLWDSYRSHSQSTRGCISYEYWSSSWNSLMTRCSKARCKSCYSYPQWCEDRSNHWNNGKSRNAGWWKSSTFRWWNRGCI